MSKDITISLKYLLPLLAAVLAVSPLAVDMYLPAMPVIATDLSTDISMIQNSLSIYLLGYALGLVLFGPMADKYSRRKLVMLGVGGFFIASILLPFVQSIEQFLLLRFCQAFISSAATVVVPSTIKEYYGKNTAKGLSYVSMIMMLAPMIAPAIGSFLLVSHSWQLIFFALSTYSLFIFVLVYFFLPEANKIVNRKEYSFIERYKIVFSNQEARLDIASSMVISLAFFSYITAIPFVYLEVFKVSEYTFSMLFALNIVALMSAHFTNTRLVTRKGSRSMLWYGLIVATVGSTALFIVNIYQLPLVYTVVALFPLMGSLSMIAVNSDALVITKFTEQSGTATAVIGTLRWSIGALAGPILAYFYDGTGLPFAGLMFTSIIVVVGCQLLIKFKQKQVTISN